MCLLLFRDCQGGFKFGQASPERFKITLLQAAEGFDRVRVGGLTSGLVSCVHEGDFRADFLPLPSPTPHPPRDLGSPSTLNPAVREEEVWSLLEVTAG